MTRESAGVHGSGLIAGEEEFGRQRVAREKGVDPVGIGLEPLLRPGRKRGEAPFGLAIEAERANELVDAEKIGARISAMRP